MENSEQSCPLGLGKEHSHCFILSKIQREQKRCNVNMNIIMNHWTTSILLYLENYLMSNPAAYFWSPGLQLTVSDRFDRKCIKQVAALTIFSSEDMQQNISGECKQQLIKLVSTRR
jgi:hypothetical protein